ncbi:MAG: CoA transferase, partial [Chloroflexi bacterium]|nr:CoA transferase [Chloroflexota bacterium]
MPGALNGRRVLDFGQYIAGPAAAMLLADQGADVLRIDPPGGPRWATPANATWNRGKRRLTLDLKSEEGRTAALDLAHSADVLIENFRPGVMHRLGLGAAALTAAHPGLVYCSLPGFAPDDPRAALAAWEGVVGAATATYRPGAATARPVYTAIPIASMYAAIQGAVSIAMALHARERDGAGQRIEVPLFDAMYAAIGGRGVRLHSAPPSTAGTPTPLIRTYRCADGRWVMLHLSTSRFIGQFIEATGTQAWQDEGLYPRPRIPVDSAKAQELAARLTALFRTRTAQEWEDFLSAHGMEAAVCHTAAEWLEHPHPRAAGMVIEHDDPQYGRMLQPGIQVRLERTPGEVRASRDLSAPPDDWAATPQTAAPPAEPAATMRAALDGVRVLDLCIILAGPTCGRTLAEFGADVIKIDDPNREGGIVFHNDINRAKRSLLLDLKTADGLATFWKLVDTADVIVQNYRLGAAERLGISYEEVRKRKPDVIYASLNTYGHTGPWAGRPGHEQLAQAATGMQERFGGDGAPVLQPYAVNDYGTGFLGAYGVALALLHRQRTGEGQHLTTALAFTSGTLQSAFFHGYEGKVWDEPRGQDALGSGPLHRLYQASDGWLFLGACRADLPRLAALEGLAGLDAAGDDPALAALLEERIAAGTVAAWVERLTTAGAGAHAVAAISELMDDPWA